MAKNVVITGATSGIGEAIARAYLEQGENVVLTGRRIDRLETLKSEFAATYPNQTVWTFSLDVTGMAMVKTVCSERVQQFIQLPRQRLRPFQMDCELIPLQQTSR